MRTVILVVVVIFVLVAVWLLSSGRRLRQRREALMKSPFPAAWDVVLRDKFSLYRKLPSDLRRRLQQHIHVLLAEKRFEACGGLPAITDEMRLLILAQAALLLIGRPGHDFFQNLRSILVYPSSFWDSGRRTFDLPDEDSDVRLGESWTTGSVILAWDSVKSGAAGRHDGVNVVLHEFAHQLDQVDGAADGAPILDDPDEYEDWARVFQTHFEALIEQSEDPHGQPLLDEYGATDPAEFFAVATEAFFERPNRMRHEMSDLYSELKDYYGLDPASWKSED